MDWKTKRFIVGQWERDWINKGEIGKYSVDEKDEHRDKNNKVKEEFQMFVLRTLM